MSLKVNIKVSRETRDRLKTYGTSGDTLDSVINKALDCLEAQHDAMR